MAQKSWETAMALTLVSLVWLDQLKLSSWSGRIFFVFALFWGAVTFVRLMRERWRG